MRRLTHDEAVALLIAGLQAIFFGRYGITIVQHSDKQPTLATWILFGVGTSFSLITYFKAERSKRSVVGNVANVVDVAGVGFVLATIFMFGNNIRYAFEMFEIVCLTASGLLMIYWLATKHAFRANLGIQVIMGVAFLPTVRTLWLWQEQSLPEDPTTWVFGWLACVLFLYLTLRKGDSLPLVYASRALTGTTIVLVLLLRLAQR